VSFITPTPADAVAPVPIPGAAILFGSGLLAVVGFRRKANS
jgi:hypothetical protein